MKIPDIIQDSTPTWLTETLRAKGAITQAGVTAYEVQRFGEAQGVSGQMVRITLNYAGFCNITLPRYCAAILDLDAGALLADEILLK